MEASDPSGFTGELCQTFKKKFYQIFCNLLQTIKAEEDFLTQSMRPAPQQYEKETNIAEYRIIG